VGEDHFYATVRAAVETAFVHGDVGIASELRHPAQRRVVWTGTSPNDVDASLTPGFGVDQWPEATVDSDASEWGMTLQ
jgi:hypothetical protein